MEPNKSPTEYEKILDAWRAGSITPRPEKRPDGIPTRIDRNWHTSTEEAITKAMYEVENMGGSAALTDAVTLLSKARDRVADHVEGKALPNA